MFFNETAAWAPFHRVFAKECPLSGPLCRAVSRECALVPFFRNDFFPRLLRPFLRCLRCEECSSLFPLVLVFSLPFLLSYLLEDLTLSLSVPFSLLFRLPPASTCSTLVGQTSYCITLFPGRLSVQGDATSSSYWPGRHSLSPPVFLCARKGTKRSEHSVPR